MCAMSLDFADAKNNDKKDAIVKIYSYIPCILFKKAPEKSSNTYLKPNLTRTH